MAIPTTPQDLINLIREKLFNNTSGIIDEPSLREVLEYIVNILDAKFSLLSPNLTEEQFTKWNLILDYMVAETLGVLLPSSTAPTHVGKYILGAAGTYTNLGGLVATADKLNYAYFNGTNWSLISVSLPSASTLFDENNNSATATMLAIASYVNTRISVINEVLEKSANLIDKSALLSGLYGSTGNVTAKDNWVRSPKIEITASTEYTLSGMYNVPTTAVMIIFFDASNNYISGYNVMGRGTNANSPYTFTSPSNAKYVAFNLSNVTNAVLDPSNSLTAQTALLRAGTSTEYETFGSKVPVAKVKGLNFNSDIYFSFSLTSIAFPTGVQSNTPTFMIYVRQKGTTNKYIGFRIVRENNTSDFPYVNYWRIYDGYEHTLANGVMTSTGILAIGNGESEFVFEQNGKADWTGSYHGDEILQSFKFLYDNKEITDFATAIPLTACESFKYVVVSTMHETANSATPSTAISGHPVIAYHTKFTTFSKGKFETKNTVKFAISTTIKQLPSGLLMAGNSYSNSGISEYGTSANFIANDNTVHTAFYSNAREIQFSGTNGNIKCFSQIVRKVNAGRSATEDIDYKAKLWVQDRSTDAKYYRVIDNQIVAVDDIIEQYSMMEF